MAPPPKAGEGGAIDFTQTLSGPTGKVLMTGGIDCQTRDIPGKDCSLVPLTLGDAALLALEAPLDEDKNEDLRKKYSRDELARKLYQNPHAVLAPDQVAVIKDRIGKAWGAAQVGAAWPMLDPTLKK